MRIRIAALAFAFAAGGARPASAQSAGAGPSFLIFRYASQSALAMYSGYTAGKLLFVVGMLNNPRTEYREIMGGVGRPVGGDLTIAAAAAWTNTGWYGELYLLPSVRAGALSVSGTIQVAQPVSSEGTRAVYVSPGTALIALGGGFSAGGSVYASAEAGSLPALGAGPAIQHAVPHGSITLEMVRGVLMARNEMRLSVRSSF